MKGQGPNRRSRSGTVGQKTGENIDEVVSVGEYLDKRRIISTLMGIFDILWLRLPSLQGCVYPNTCHYYETKTL